MPLSFLIDRVLEVPASNTLAPNDAPNAFADVSVPRTSKVLKKKDYDVSSIIVFLLRIETLIMIDLAQTITEKISKSRPLLRTAFMVAELGFEPRQTESESVVLPLHNSAVIIAASSIISQKNVMSTTFLR